MVHAASQLKSSDTMLYTPWCVYEYISRFFNWALHEHAKANIKHLHVWVNHTNIKKKKTWRRLVFDDILILAGKSKLWEPTYTSHMYLITMNILHNETNKTVCVWKSYLHILQKKKCPCHMKSFHLKSWLGEKPMQRQWNFDVLNFVESILGRKSLWHNTSVSD